MSETAIRRRPPAAHDNVDWPADVPPLLRRLYAARGVRNAAQAVPRLGALLAPDGLGGIQQAAELLAAAICAEQKILIVGDYDCDGATGCAVGVRGLRMLGASHVDFVIPDRRRHGYGLSPTLLDSLSAMPDVLVTVDNGIAAHAGVAAAREQGVTVIVTDHHLPGDTLPAAHAIVNPNLADDAFASKALAGVGVLFYLLLALRARLGSKADLRELLDLVALGTVADMVALDANNRILVEAGLRRIRAGRACPGIVALAEVAGRATHSLVSQDFGFALGPRLNAAGRLDNMRVGVECLLSEDAEPAVERAQQLDHINRQRRDLQADMVDEANAIVAELPGTTADGVVVYQPHWHPGVVGLVASRLKERLHRPVVAFAPSGTPGMLRGSARSIPGVHIRDALVALATRAPGLMASFGGHAMAAGLELAAENRQSFATHFEAIMTATLDDDLRRAELWSDGELAPNEMTLDAAQCLRFAGPWGQAFPEPLFDNVFVIDEQRAIGRDANHRRLTLRDPRNNASHAGVMFRVEQDLPMQQALRVVYELSVNDYNGRPSLQLIVQHATAAWTAC